MRQGGTSGFVGVVGGDGGLMLFNLIDGGGNGGKGRDVEVAVADGPGDGEEWGLDGRDGDAVGVSGGDLDATLAVGVDLSFKEGQGFGKGGGVFEFMDERCGKADAVGGWGAVGDPLVSEGGEEFFFDVEAGLEGGGGEGVVELGGCLGVDSAGDVAGEREDFHGVEFGGGEGDGFLGDGGEGGVGDGALIEKREETRAWSVDADEGFLGPAFAVEATRVGYLGEVCDAEDVDDGVVFLAGVFGSGGVFGDGVVHHGDDGVRIGVCGEGTVGADMLHRLKIGGRGAEGVGVDGEFGSGEGADGEDHEAVFLRDGNLHGRVGGFVDGPLDDGDKGGSVGSGIAKEGDAGLGFVMICDVDGADVEGDGVAPEDSEGACGIGDFSGCVGIFFGGEFDPAGELLREISGEAGGVEDAFQIGVGIIRGESVGTLPTHIEKCIFWNMVVKRGGGKRGGE